MLRRNRQHLRQRPRISYEELEEPAFDEYLYCEECSDYVYEYCSIHEPLLVIPDEKVASKLNPSNIPAAALSIPCEFLHIATSKIPGAGLGVHATLTLPRGVRFGPYRGLITQEINSAYCWQIYDANNKPSHVIDGEDVARSNWMRYVNCARHYKEQNLLAYQYQGGLYYRTIKIIPRCTELLVFYGREFASSLNIDLRIYNSKHHYPEAIGFHSTHLDNDTKVNAENKSYRTNDSHQLNCEEVTTTTIDIAPADVVYIKNEIPEYEMVDNFQYIYDTSITKEFTAKIEAPVKMEYKNFTKIVIIDTGKAIWECNDCQKILTSKTSLRRHELTHGNAKAYNCTECNYNTNFKYLFDSHLQVHAGNYEFKCQSCTYVTNSKKNLQRHVRNVHETAPACEFCNYKVASKATMEYHKAVHGMKNVIKCDFCEYICVKNRYLQKHKRAVHNIS